MGRSNKQKNQNHTGSKPQGMSEREKKLSQAKQALVDFCNLDPTSLDLGKLNYEKQKTERVLGSADIGQNSSLYGRLDECYSTLKARIKPSSLPEESFTQTQPETVTPPSIQLPRPLIRSRTGAIEKMFVERNYKEPSLKECRADYVGCLTNDIRGYHWYNVRAIFFNNSFFLRRTYHFDGKYILNKQEHLTVDWKFNNKGKIYLVGIISNLLQNESPLLIYVPNPEKLGENWAWAIAYAYRIPYSAGVISPGLEIPGSLQKYEMLLKSGHNLAEEIISALKKKAVRNLYQKDQRQKDLTSIVNDTDALNKIKLAASSKPYVEPSVNEGMVTMTYK